MTKRTKKSWGAIPRELTDIEIVKNLPDGQFNETVLRKVINEHGITSRQSIDEHANAIIRHYLVESVPGRFTVREDALEPAKIVISVVPKTLWSRVLERTKNALKDVEYVTIEEVEL
jgi:hypothetical protein